MHYNASTSSYNNLPDTISDFGSQRILCLNDRFKLRYDKDSFLRFYKFKQSLQSQNILFNQLKQQQKLNQPNQLRKIIENKQDFFVNVQNIQNEHQIRHINVGCSLIFIQQRNSEYLGIIIGGKMNSFYKKGYSTLQIANGQQIDENSLKFNDKIDPSYSEIKASRLAYNDIYNRFGHQVHQFQNKLIIISGESGTIQGTFQGRTILGDMVIFDPLTFSKNYIQFLKPITKNRAFSSCTIGKYLYIYGGQQEKGEVTNELLRINLCQNYENPLKWKLIQCNNIKLIESPRRAYSIMVAVFYPKKFHQDKGFSLKNLTDEIDWKSAQNYISIEGVYLFGGLNEMSQPTNDLFLLSIDKNLIHQWQNLSTKGKAPPPRYMHSFLYYQNSNVLLLFGGRNDQHTNGTSTILSDLHAFNLDSMTWTEVTFCSQKLIPRFNFASGIVGTKLIIMGGQNGDYKIMHDCEIVELDQEINFQNHANKYLFKKMAVFISAKFVKNSKKSSQNLLNYQNNDLNISNQDLARDNNQIMKTKRRVIDVENGSLNDIKKTLNSINHPSNYNNQSTSTQMQHLNLKEYLQNNNKFNNSLQKIKYFEETQSLPNKKNLYKEVINHLDLKYSNKINYQAKQNLQNDNSSNNKQMFYWRRLSHDQQ